MTISLKVLKKTPKKQAILSKALQYRNAAILEEMKIQMQFLIACLIRFEERLIHCLEKRDAIDAGKIKLLQKLSRSQ